MNETPVLDKGFVRFLGAFGDDSTIVQAARVSYGDGTKSTREDAQLIDYLMRHWHTSPFEMVVFFFHLKLPIFVARQLVRHRTASLNEMSARYSEMPDEFYVPAPERVSAQSTTNKQGSGERLDKHDTNMFVEAVGVDSQEACDNYKLFLDCGIARELARINLPVNLYTEMYWQIDLHNLLHFLRLRLDNHAQWEIQEYARAIAEYVKQVTPVAYDTFERHRLNAQTFSSDELDILRASLDNYMTRERIERSDLRPSRQRELLTKLGME